MEREGVEDKYRLMRAIRSLAYNRELKPLVEDRIERAETKIRGYMMTRNLMTTRVGSYQIDMDDEGGIVYSRLSVDEWQQLPIPQITNTEKDGEIPNISWEKRDFREHFGPTLD